MEQFPSFCNWNRGWPYRMNFLTGEDMTFQFQIIDEAQASPANAEYNCELYIDLNCDGQLLKI